MTRVTSHFDRWGSGLLSELTTLALFLGTLYLLARLIMWLL
jgi:hypothetical protein